MTVKNITVLCDIRYPAYRSGVSVAVFCVPSIVFLSAFTFMCKVLG